MNIPKLRFKGFNDEWKSNRLGNIFKNVSDKGYDYLPVLSVTQDNGVVYRNELKIDIKYNHSTLNTYKRVRIGQFIISLRSFQGGLELSDKLGIVSPAYTILDSVVNIDVNYWKYYFKTYNFIEHLKSTIIGIRDGKQINYSSFKDLKGNFPCLEEQQKIGALFAKLDNLIDLQAKKLELLKQLKQGLLQKLFPQNNQTIPQLRFKGFNDEWEIKKLNNLVNITSGFMGDASLHSGKYCLTRIETIAKNKIDLSRLGFSNIKPDNKYLLNKGDILFSNINSLAHIGKTAIKLDNTILYHGINLLRLACKNNVDNKFMFYLLNNYDSKTWAIRHANIAVNQASINQTTLSKRKIYIPNLMKEQQQIGALFNKVDNLLTKEQEKITLFKQVKKYLLQRMFI